MAQETKPLGAKEQLQHPHEHIGDDEVSELEGQQPRSFYVKVREQAERFASTRPGQFVIERADRALKMIEDTAKWSLPQEKNADPLERPLPWVPFLLMIVLLRLTRIWLSAGAMMIGNSPVAPSDVIYFIQTRRRKLRAIRVHGLKVMRRRQQEAASAAACGTGSSYTQQLGQWMTKAMCRPGVQRVNSGRLFNMRSGEAVETTPKSQAAGTTVTKRPRDEEASQDHNLTIDEMLAKYANENSEDDSDFVPNPEDESSDNSSSESDSSAESSSSSSTEKENGDETLVILENGGHKMPKPLMEIKTEPKSDIDSGNEQTKRNGNGNGNGNSDKEKEKEKAKAPGQAQTLAKTSGQDVAEKEAGQQKLQLPAPDDEWKASPGHMSAAKMQLPPFHNAAAAAPTDRTDNDIDNDIDNDKDNINDKDIDIDYEYDTDSSASTSTVYQTSFQAINPDPADSIETTLPLPVLSNIPSAIETLTPATSSEDIYYSPIGSPSAFNTYVGQPQSILKNATVKSVVVHSTPNSEMEDQQHSEASDVEAAVIKNISLSYQQEQSQPQPQSQSQQQQQQQQRQHQHQSHRYRGRNRR